MVQQGEYEREVDLGQLILSLLKKSKNIFLAGMIFALLITVLKFITIDPSITNQEKVSYYTATDYVGRAKIFLGSDTDTATSEAIRSYFTGNDVIQNVIGNMDYNEEEFEITYLSIYSHISTQYSTDSMIVLSYVGTEEAMVQEITDLLATIGSKKISEKFNKDAVMILEPAYTEIREYKAEVKEVVTNNTLLIKHLVKYVAIGFVLGSFIAAGVYLLLFMFDTSIKDEKDVIGYLGVPVLGKIPVIKETKKIVEKDKAHRSGRLNQYVEE